MRPPYELNYLSVVGAPHRRHRAGAEGVEVLPVGTLRAGFDRRDLQAIGDCHGQDTAAVERHTPASEVIGRTPATDDPDVVEAGPRVRVPLRQVDFLELPRLVSG